MAGQQEVERRTSISGRLQGACQYRTAWKCRPGFRRDPAYTGDTGTQTGGAMYYIVPIGVDVKGCHIGSWVEAQRERQI